VLAAVVQFDRARQIFRTDLGVRIEYRTEEPFPVVAFVDEREIGPDLRAAAVMAVAIAAKPERAMEENAATAVGIGVVCECVEACEPSVRIGEGGPVDHERGGFENGLHRGRRTRVLPGDSEKSYLRLFVDLFSAKAAQRFFPDRR